MSFGLSAYWLYQKANDSLSDDDDAFGGIYRFQGSWVAFARDSGHPGRLEWRVENRNEIGSYLSPSQLGGQVGAAALNTGFGYSHNFSTDLSVLNWTQVLFDKRAGFAVGRLAFDVYLDAFMFQTFSRGFLNRASLVNPTIGTTGLGALGAVAKEFVTENILIGGSDLRRQHRQRGFRFRHLRGTRMAQGRRVSLNTGHDPLQDRSHSV